MWKKDLHWRPQLPTVHPKGRMQPPPSRISSPGAQKRRPNPPLVVPVVAYIGACSVRAPSPDTGQLLPHPPAPSFKTGSLAWNMHGLGTHVIWNTCGPGVCMSGVYCCSAGCQGLISPPGLHSLTCSWEWLSDKVALSQALAVGPSMDTREVWGGGCCRGSALPTSLCSCPAQMDSPAPSSRLS